MNRVIQFILKAKDEASAVFGKVSGATQSFGKNMSVIGKQVSADLNSMVGRWLSFGAVAAVLTKVNNITNEYNASLRKLEGTAKITGVPLGFLQSIAADAKEKFGLAAVGANDLTTEVAKLAGKAGDLGMTAPLLERFLDIGAAKGLSAADTLTAVKQSILGIDEGTDKLFGKNPSVIYKEFADAIGTTAGKLTDQQKAMAIATTAMDDGGKVVGAYKDYLQSAAGQQEQANNKWQEAAITLGQALAPALSGAATLVGGLGKVLGWMIDQWEIFILQLGFAAQAIGPTFKGIAGSVIEFLGDMFDKLRDLPLIGDKFGAIADTLRAKGKQMVSYNKIYLEELHGQFEESVKEVLGTEARKWDGVLDLTKKKNKEITDEVKKAQAAIKKEMTDSATAANNAWLAIWRSSTTKFEAEQTRRAALLKGATGEQAKALTENWRRIDDAQMVVAAGLERELVPAVQRTEHQFHALRTTTGALPRPILDVNTGLVTLNRNLYQMGHGAQAAEGQLAKAFGSAGQAAGAFGDFATGLGLVDDAAGNAIQSVGNLADAVGKVVGGGLSTGGMIGAITAASAAMVGILGAIFAGSGAVERRREQLLARANELMAQNNANMGQLLKIQTPGGKFADLSNVLKGLLGSTVEGGVVLGAGFKEITAALSEKGLTVGDLKTFLKDIGLEDLADKIKPGALLTRSTIQTILDVLSSMHPTMFGTGWEDKLAAFEAKKGVGLVTAGTEAQGYLDIVESMGGVLGEAIANADLSTAEGTAAFVATVQGLITKLANGELTPEDLGGLNGPQFLAAIQQIFGLLTDDIADIFRGTVIDPLVQPPIDPNVAPPDPDPGADGTTGDTRPPVTGGTVVSASYDILPPLVHIDTLLTGWGESFTLAVDYLGHIDQGVATLVAGITKWVDIDTGAVMMAGGGAAMPAAIDTVNITVNVAQATEAPGAIADDITRVLNERLGAAYQAQQLARGIV